MTMTDETMIKYVCDRVNLRVFLSRLDKSSRQFFRRFSNMSLQTWLREREMRNHPPSETIIAPIVPLYVSKGEAVIDRAGIVIAVCQHARIAKALADTLSRIKWQP